jgi:hypothetical protein
MTLSIAKRLDHARATDARLGTNRGHAFARPGHSCDNSITIPRRPSSCAWSVAMSSHPSLTAAWRAPFVRAVIFSTLFAILGGWRAPQTLAQGVVGGVYIDPAGMLRESSTLAQADLAARLHDAAATEGPSQPVSAPSPLRKISLRRLERAVAEFHAAGKSVPPDVRCLAGITAITYVFVYPETGDVVLAGPAEGWEVSPAGDIVGRQSRRPVLQLDDLIVALRYAFADGPANSFLGCSIEPTETGLKSHAAYVRWMGTVDRAQLPQVLRGMEEAIGPQDIHVYGIEGSNRFALQMIAADYRLKRISLAHDPSPSKKVPSYLDLAEKTVNGGPQRQHRWWFVGHYDAIRHTADRLAYEFEGNGLKVETAPTQPGKFAPRNAPKPTRAAATFAELATKHFPELADNIPAFAELRNLVGLAVAAVLVRQQAEAVAENIAAAAGDDDADPAPARRYRPGRFLDEKRCPIASFELPKQCPALANGRYVKDQFWMFSVSGGVEINPESLVAGDRLKPAVGVKLAETHARSSAPDGASWWWD